MYEQSVNDPEGFWGEHGKRIHWFTPYSQVKDVSFGPGNVHIKWFHDGTTNASYSCIDRHLAGKKDDVAIIWEGDDPGEDKHITYGELHEAVCRLANALKARGVKKGDRVLFSKYAGTEITLEGEERLILREDDVLGILE